MLCTQQPGYGELDCSCVEEYLTKAHEYCTEQEKHTMLKDDKYAEKWLLINNCFWPMTPTYTFNKPACTPAIEDILIPKYLFDRAKDK